MTALAKRHQVVIIVSAAFCKWELVMYFFYRNIPSVLEALFTKRMLGHIPCSYLPPLASISFVGFGVTQVMIVLVVCLCLVFLAVVLFC